MLPHDYYDDDHHHQCSVGNASYARQSECEGKNQTGNISVQFIRCMYSIINWWGICRFRGEEVILPYVRFCFTHFCDRDEDHVGCESQFVAQVFSSRECVN